MPVKTMETTIILTDRGARYSANGCVYWLCEHYELRILSDCDYRVTDTMGRMIILTDREVHYCVDGQIYWLCDEYELRIPDEDRDRFLHSVRGSILPLGYNKTWQMGGDDE